MEKRLPRAYACYNDRAGGIPEPSPQAQMRAANLALLLRACALLALALRMAKTKSDILPMLLIVTIQNVLIPRIEG